MGFVSIPNLPQNIAGFAIVDGRISLHAVERLRDFGIEIIKMPGYPNVYEAISHHPDITLHHLGDEYIVHAPGIDKEVIELLKERGFVMIPGETVPGREYPSDISYNAARVGNFYFHNLKYTDPVLKRELARRGVEPIHVNQGYSKCSISIIDSSSIITSDFSIAKAAEAKGIEALLITNRQNILLPGLDYGFIGGSTGLISPEIWAVNGDARKLASFKEISDFLTRKNVKILSLTDGDVCDIGSIISL